MSLYTFESPINQYLLTRKTFGAAFLRCFRKLPEALSRVGQNTERKGDARNSNRSMELLTVSTMSSVCYQLINNREAECSPITLHPRKCVFSQFRAALSSPCRLIHNISFLQRPSSLTLSSISLRLQLIQY